MTIAHPVPLRGQAVFRRALSRSSGATLRSIRASTFAALALSFAAGGAGLSAQDCADGSGTCVAGRASRFYEAERFDPEVSAALFVGVRDFIDGEGNPSKSIDEVPYAVDDAVDLAYVFAIELGLVVPDRVTLALSGDPQKPESVERLRRLEEAGARHTNAGFTNLSRLMSLVPRQAEPGGMLLISVATHGFEEEGVWMLAADSDRGNLARTSVSVTSLLDDVTQSRTTRRVVLLDACRERLGSGTRGLGNGAAVSEGLSLEIGRSTGTAVLMGTNSGGFSYDDEELRNGVFSAAVVEGLRGGAAFDERGFLTLGTLTDFVDNRVRRWVAENRPEHVGISTGIHVQIDGSARSMPLRQDSEARRVIQLELQRQGLLLTLLRSRPGSEHVPTEMVDGVEDDLRRLSISETGPLVSALESFLGEGAGIGTVGARRLATFYGRWREAHPTPTAQGTRPVPTEIEAVRAEEGPPPERASEPGGPTADQIIRDVIAAYRLALEALSLAEIRAIYPTFDAAEYDNYRRLPQLTLTLEPHPNGITVNSGDAVVRVTRVISWRGGEFTANLEFRLRRIEGNWQIVSRRTLG